MLSCPPREDVRRETLAGLRATDWGEAPTVEIDRSSFERPQDRQAYTSLCLLRRAIDDQAEVFLFLEDDLAFNRHLRHNLSHWHPLASLESGAHFFGSLYNPNIYEIERDQERSFFIAHPEAVYGSQAFILSLATATYIVARWDEVAGMQDIKMSRLAAQVCPIYYHTPSLVQHVGQASMWGGPYHWAPDFDAYWRAEAT
jgi:hypothetical protein